MIESGGYSDSEEAGVLDNDEAGGISGGDVEDSDFGAGVASTGSLQVHSSADNEERRDDRQRMRGLAIPAIADDFDRLRRVRGPSPCKDGCTSTVCPSSSSLRRPASSATVTCGHVV